MDIVQKYEKASFYPSDQTPEFVRDFEFLFCSAYFQRQVFERMYIHFHAICTSFADVYGPLKLYAFLVVASALEIQYHARACYHVRTRRSIVMPNVVRLDLNEYSLATCRVSTYC